MSASRELEQTVQELCFESSLQVRTNHQNSLQEHMELIIGTNGDLDALAGITESHTNQLFKREKDIQQKRHTGREKHRLCTTVTRAVRQTQRESDCEKEIVKVTQ